MKIKKIAYLMKLCQVSLKVCATGQLYRMIITLNNPMQN